MAGAVEANTSQKWVLLLAPMRQAESAAVCFCCLS